MDLCANSTCLALCAPHFVVPNSGSLVAHTVKTCFSPPGHRVELRARDPERHRGQVRHSADPNSRTRLSRFLFALFPDRRVVCMNINRNGVYNAVLFGFGTQEMLEDSEFRQQSQAREYREPACEAGSSEAGGLGQDRI